MTSVCTNLMDATSGYVPSLPSGTAIASVSVTALSKEDEVSTLRPFGTPLDAAGHLGSGKRAWTSYGAVRGEVSCFSQGLDLIMSCFLFKMESHR